MTEHRCQFCKKSYKTKAGSKYHEYSCAERTKQCGVHSITKEANTCSKYECKHCSFKTTSLRYLCYHLEFNCKPYQDKLDNDAEVVIAKTRNDNAKYTPPWFDASIGAISYIWEEDTVYEDDYSVDYLTDNDIMGLDWYDVVVDFIYQEKISLRSYTYTYIKEIPGLIDRLEEDVNTLLGFTDEKESPVVLRRVPTPSLEILKSLTPGELRMCMNANNWNLDKYEGNLPNKIDLPE